jgi:hypothetical protein
MGASAGARVMPPEAVACRQHVEQSLRGRLLSDSHRQLLVHASCSNSALPLGLISMAKPNLKLISPATVNRTVIPLRRPNKHLRTREHLTPKEVDRLIEAVTGNRWGHRDASMILLAYRHGLRAAELVDLRWDQVDFDQAVLHVRRVKSGIPSTHPLAGLEMRALRRLRREGPDSPLSRRIRTCCATPADTSLPTMATTPALYRPTSGTRTSSTRCTTRSWRRPGSRASGGTERQRAAGPIKPSPRIIMKASLAERAVAIDRPRKTRNSGCAVDLWYENGSQYKVPNADHRFPFPPGLRFAFALDFPPAASASAASLSFRSFAILARSASWRDLYSSMAPSVVSTDREGEAGCSSSSVMSASPSRRARPPGVGFEDPTG